MSDAELSLLDGQVAKALANISVPFVVVPCDEDKADTEAFCAAYGYSLSESANTIVVVGKSDPPVYAACVLLADSRLDVNKTVKQRLGTRKASFAPSDVSVALTGQTPGGITPVGLPAGLPLWADAAVMACDRIVIGGGTAGARSLLPRRCSPRWVPRSSTGSPSRSCISQRARAMTAQVGARTGRTVQ